MTPDELYQEFVDGFGGRKFSAGLLVAFINFLTSLGVPGAGLGSAEEFLAKYPRRQTTAAGKRANTLIVTAEGGKTLSLRPFYNAAAAGAAPPA